MSVSVEVSVEAIQVCGSLGTHPMGYDEAFQLQKDLFDPPPPPGSHCLGVWVASRNTHPASAALWGAVATAANHSARTLFDSIIPAYRETTRSELLASAEEYRHYQPRATHGVLTLSMALSESCNRFVRSLMLMRRAEWTYQMFVSTFDKRVDPSTTCSINDIQAARQWTSRICQLRDSYSIECETLNAAIQECDRKANAYRSLMRCEDALKRLRTKKTA